MFNAKASLRMWRRRQVYRLKKERYWIKRGNKAEVLKWSKLRKQADLMVARRQRQTTTLGERAWDVAGTLLAVREVGGNNMGPMVTKIIREDGGSGPEPWCGDFDAYCYRHAGSTAPNRSWAATSLIGRSPGVKIIPKEQVRVGDILVFDFRTGGPIHMGLYGEMMPDNFHLRTREGNTTAAGADNVSDAASTSDGVYEKTNRTWSDVLQVIRVER